VGHVEVGDDDIERVVGLCSVFEGIDAIVAVGGDVDAVTGEVEGALKGFADEGFVVDTEDVEAAL